MSSHEFTKAEAMNAISIVGLAKSNAEGYCKDAGDIAVSAIVALKMAVQFAKKGIPPDVVETLTYRDPRETCKHCNIPMELGKALVNRATGVNDFAGGAVVTMSLDPKQSVMVDCWKCTECGFSRSAGSESH